MTEQRDGVILLDALDGAEERFDASFLEKIGHPVLVCHGPAESELCPLLEGAGCSKFDEAHGIVFELDLDRPQHRAIVKKYRDLGGEDMPIKVVVTPEQAERFHDLLANIEVWLRAPTVADLDGFAAEVEAADRLAEADRSEHWVG